MKTPNPIEIVKSAPLPRVKKQFKANIYAHALAFILNVSIFIFTENFFFIWVQIASLCFIGVNKSRSPQIVDMNMVNHFVAVMIFYISSMLIGNNELLYLGLIFVFTYSFFIIRDNGYGQSFNLWMYIQALLIGTTFTTYPFSFKVYATIVAFIESIIILNITLFIFKNENEHKVEHHYLKVIKIPLEKWLDIKHPEVKLAIRGAFTAVILYAICKTFNDAKPNWAVVTAISCLTRDDKVASVRAMKGILIGTIVGWPICLAIAHYFDQDIVLITFMIWIFLLLGLISSFEATIKPRLIISVLTTISLLIAVACVGVAFHINELNYINLKIINTIVGLTCALTSLLIWGKMNQIFEEVET
jgi:hypothetical protein